MALPRELRLRLMFLWDDLTDLLPDIPYYLVAALVSLAVPVVIADLPPVESVPVALLLVAMLIAIWWQWFRMNALRQRLTATKARLDDAYEGNYSQEDED